MFSIGSRLYYTCLELQDGKGGGRGVIEKSDPNRMKVVSYSAPTETAPRRVSFRPPPVSPPPPEQTRDRDSHESAHATRRRRARTQLTSLSTGPSWHPTVKWPRPRTRRPPAPSLAVLFYFVLFIFSPSPTVLLQPKHRPGHRSTPSGHPSLRFPADEGMEIRSYGSSLLAYHQGEPGSISGRVTPDFRKLESCRTMPLVSGFSRESSVSPPFCSDAAPFSPHFSLIDSQDLVDKSRIASLQLEKHALRCYFIYYFLNSIILAAKALHSRNILDIAMCLPLPEMSHSSRLLLNCVRHTFHDFIIVLLQPLKVSVMNQSKPHQSAVFSERASCIVAFTRRIPRPLVRSRHEHLVPRRLTISRRRLSSSPMSLAGPDFIRLSHSAHRLIMSQVSCQSYPATGRRDRERACLCGGEDLVERNGGAGQKHSEKTTGQRQYPQLFLTCSSPGFTWAWELKPLLFGVGGERTDSYTTPSPLCDNSENHDSTQEEQHSAQWLACSPPTKANLVLFPAGLLPDFHMWENPPLVGGFSRGTPVSPRCSILASLNPYRLSRPG
ncbi:hypothetical protein PR048_004444 [Dryococelus australis]|uniref:Uncharacterized protein n=1 Tax=Dryococelus australis TaxID=614101 RepID=A0ABQ9I5G1_9NEOP|nr:hypothetical protein PR048_004444 [Dryococelus australis]